MTILTEAFVRGLAPHARADYVDALVNGGEDVLAEYGFNTPWRVCHFLAQVLHETGRLRVVRESMTYTTAARIRGTWPSRFPSIVTALRFVRKPVDLAEKVYGGRMGNQRNGVGDGDGFRYRGGGFGQLTGYDNYLHVGRKIEVDLAGHPELIEDARVSLRAAACEYAEFLQYADRGERGLRAFSNGVNRGDPLSSYNPIGWTGDNSRQECFRDVARAMGLIGSTDDVLEPGEHGQDVLQAQERLCALGYVLGACDGIYGRLTRDAVLSFQAENGLVSDGKIGPQTRGALFSADAKPRNAGDRATASIGDLTAKGSETVKSADAIVKTGQAVVGVTAAVEATKQVDVLTGFSDGLKEIGILKGLVGQASELAVWALSHWWIATIVVGFALWRWGSQIKFARLVAHRLGLNLAR